MDVARKQNHPEWVNPDQKDKYVYICFYMDVNY